MALTWLYLHRSLYACPHQFTIKPQIVLQDHQINLSTWPSFFHKDHLRPSVQTSATTTTPSPAALQTMASLPHQLALLHHTVATLLEDHQVDRLRHRSRSAEVLQQEVPQLKHPSHSAVLLNHRLRVLFAAHQHHSQLLAGRLAWYVGPQSRLNLPTLSSWLLHLPPLVPHIHQIPATESTIVSSKPTMARESCVQKT